MPVTRIKNNVVTDNNITPSKLAVTAAMQTFLGNATSANLASTVNGTTGTGNLVFAANPTFADSINITSTGWANVTITRGGVGQKGAVGFSTTGVLNTNNPAWEFGIRDGNASFSINTWNGSVLSQRITFHPLGGVSIGNTIDPGSNNLIVAGAIAVGSAAPNSSSIVDLQSTTRGFLPPRMTISQRNAITTPAAGLTVYTTDGFNMSYHNGTSWGDVFSSHSSSFTSESLRNAVSDETGSGNLVFNNNPTIQNYTEASVVNGNSGSAVTLSLANGTKQSVTLTANCTFTLPPPSPGKSFTLYVYTGTGGFTASFTGVRWPGNVQPIITSAANRYDIITFDTNPEGTLWSASIAQNFFI